MNNTEPKVYSIAAANRPVPGCTISGGLPASAWRPLL